MVKAENERPQVELLYRDIKLLNDEKTHLRKGIEGLIEKLEGVRDLEIDKVLGHYREGEEYSRPVEYYEGRTSFLQSVLNDLQKILKY